MYYIHVYKRNNFNTVYSDNLNKGISYACYLDNFFQIHVGFETWQPERISIFINTFLLLYV